MNYNFSERRRAILQDSKFDHVTTEIALTAFFYARSRAKVDNDVTPHRTQVHVC